jgi:hypothetical protein
MPGIIQGIGTAKSLGRYRRRNTQKYKYGIIYARQRWYTAEGHKVGSNGMVKGSRQYKNPQRQSHKKSYTEYRRKGQ